MNAFVLISTRVFPVYYSRINYEPTQEDIIVITLGSHDTSRDKLTLLNINSMKLRPCHLQLHIKHVPLLLN